MQEMENKVVEYRVDQLEKTTDNIVKSVSSMGDKVNTMFTDQALTKQRLLIYMTVVGFVYNLMLAVGVPYVLKDKEEYSEKDKMKYYEARVKDTETIRELREEIARLKRGER